MDTKELGVLPVTAERARALGIQYYYTGKACKAGHKAPRYTSSGNCTRCCELRRGQEIPRKGRAEENYRRAIVSFQAGETTYVPEKPCRHGHTLRFIGSNNCVECARLSVSKKKQEGYHRHRYLKKTYGITPEDYQLLLRKQGGGCALCGATADFRALHVDHDHATGKIRGILCGPCNQGLGLFKESLDLLRRATSYLKKHA